MATQTQRDDLPPLPATLDTFGGQEAALTSADVQRHVQLIQRVLRDVMKEGVHYGRIPGVSKKSLWKPGAEVILTTFRLGAQPTEVREVDNGFQVTMRVFHIPTGQTVGYGMGMCSWHEEKYRWRAAVNESEWENSPEGARRWKYRRDGPPVRQVATNPADYLNTCLKMAMKRARVDACLTATAASDVFDQDLEDLPEGAAATERNGNRPGGPINDQAETVPAADAAKVLKAIEIARNVDELTLVMDTINTIKGKDKSRLVVAYRARLGELQEASK